MMTDMLNRGRDCNRGCGGMDESMLFIFLILILCGGFGNNSRCR